MKYHRLSQDQLNSVYKQFILFLSSKGIDKECWDKKGIECECGPSWWDDCKEHQ